MSDSTDEGVDAATHRRLAIGLFNHVWTLLGLTERTVEQDDEMLHAAHASRYHWAEATSAGDAERPQRLAIGEWQCARVYSVLGRAEPALHHARRCLELCEANEMEPWVITSAYEAMARASRVAGDVAGMERFAAMARDAVAELDDEDDREVMLRDLATI